MAADLSDIQPGTTLKIDVVAEPTNQAAKKTIARVLGKDATIAQGNRLQSRIRRKNYNPQMRGGRLYSGKVVKQHLVKSTIGESGTVIATSDVLRDLNSVKRFIAVSAA